MTDAKRQLILEIKVPKSIKNDPHEYYTQEDFTQALLIATDKLGLSMSELTDIKDYKGSKAELMAILSMGRSQQ